jgi:hypothetical protein
MKARKQKLTLDQPAIYQIKVPGELDASWSEWVEELSVSVELGDDDLPVTTLTGHFDQAALHGLLRRLYSLGISLISVVCLDFI